MQKWWLLFVPEVINTESWLKVCLIHTNLHHMVCRGWWEYTDALKDGSVLLSNIQAGPGWNFMQPRAHLLVNPCITPRGMVNSVFQYLYRYKLVSLCDWFHFIFGADSLPRPDVAMSRVMVVLACHRLIGSTSTWCRDVPMTDKLNNYDPVGVLQNHASVETRFTFAAIFVFGFDSK